MNYLMEKGAPVDQTDKSGRTALHWAVISGHKEATDILLAKVCAVGRWRHYMRRRCCYCRVDFGVALASLARPR